ncbi:hypothetical protein [Calothrix sp. NIES-3974]|nr:hypothetical protein [Calothrix sp. NIES-3974]
MGIWSCPGLIAIAMTPISGIIGSLLDFIHFIEEEMVARSEIR